DVCKKYIKLFVNGYSPAMALYTYENSFYLNTKNDQKLMLLLADCAQNPDYRHKLELFELFLETIKNDYENDGPQLQASLKKLAKGIMQQKPSLS
ncbi:17418_t:CDS:2, partial [Gigaspora margarita]